MVSEFGFGTVVELASDSANVVEAVMAGLDAVQSAVQLVASSGSDRVNSITPASYSDVAGQTVEFQVEFNACPACALETTAGVTLTSPLYVVACARPRSCMHSLTFAHVCVAAFG